MILKALATHKMKGDEEKKIEIPTAIDIIAVNQSELQIWSLQISSLERIPAHKCVLTFLEHHQSTQHGYRYLFA